MASVTAAAARAAVRTGERTVFPSRYAVGLVTVLGAILLVALAPRLDTDLWWHLQEGAYIWTHHAPASHDYLSFTFAGHPWTDQEWLSNLLLYGLFRLGGLWGTIAGFAIVICATFGLVYARMAGNRVHPMLALFVIIVAIIPSMPTWGARPQMVTLFFLALYALLLDRYVRERSRRLLVLFPLLMLIWVNAHGGWVLGAGLMVLTLLGEYFNRRSHAPDALSTADLKALSIAGGATILATIANPYGLHVILYPLVWLTPTAYSNVLNEWVSPNFHEPAFMVFEALLLVMLLSFFLARSRPDWRHLLIVLAFTHLAVSQSRNVAVWCVVISPLLALYIGRAMSRREEAASPAPRTGSLSRGRQRAFNTVLLVFVAVLYTFEAAHFVSNAALARAERTTYPTGAVAYMQTHRLPANTLAAYAWGGYVIWKLGPHYRDFIDGRANTLFDARILADYLDAYSATPRWQTVLDRYHVQNVLIPPVAPLAQVLAESRRWRLVYRNSVAVLYTLAPHR